MPNAEGISHALAEKLAGARAGSARDAALAAALIHRHASDARSLGVNSHYDSLLANALFSKDPELLVCVAEELVRGVNLARNADLARRFFDKARELGPPMGAYALGRMAVSVDNTEAKRLFAIGQRHGHIPSMISRHKLISASLPVVGYLARLLFLISDFYATWAACFQKERVRERFWRYRDVFPRPLRPVEIEMPRDRDDVFSELESLTKGK